MQTEKKKKKTPKKKLIYKEYKRGSATSKEIYKEAGKLIAYYLIFAFMFVLLGSALQFDSVILRVFANLAMVAACTMLTFMNGARLGESQTALGEQCYKREQTGKSIDPEDAAKCYHPMKGFVIFLLASVPLWLITLPYAFLAEKAVYALQALPSWVSGYAGHDEIAAPLAYYSREISMEFRGILQIIVRLLIFPFANIATADNPDAMLLVDRLSPLLVVIPALGYPLGYLTGPRARAMVHGDIAASERKHKKKERRERKARQEKKKELI